MTMTRHGWHIPGSTYDDERFWWKPYECEGISYCIDCGIQAGTVRRVIPGQLSLDIEDPRLFIDILEYAINSDWASDEKSLTFINGLIKETIAKGDWPSKDSDVL